jgi:hypothetical protein
MSFGEEPKTIKAKGPVKLLLAPQPINQIESQLYVTMLAEMPIVPVSFDQDGELSNPEDFEAYYGRPFTLAEAVEMWRIENEHLGPQYRLQLLTARDLGSKATWEEFLLACEMQGIAPLIGGPTQ